MNAGYYGQLGTTVGQAHLLDDMISMVRELDAPHEHFELTLLVVQLELDPTDGPSIFERMAFTYGVGDQHGLYEPLREAQKELST